MRRAWGLLALIVAGCVEPGAVTCGDFICAAGSRCMTAPSGPPRCVTPDQVAACEGLQPFGACGDDGRCYELVEALACLDAGCGNGFTDPEEQCDDLNNRSLDGCSADCRSDEKCGNGVIDALQAEQCDDANHLSHDGCSSNCRNEAAAWIPVGTDTPLSYAGVAVTFDSRRGRFVMAGGIYNSPIQGGAQIPNLATWEWNGSAWTSYFSAVSPFPRIGASLAYDPDRRLTVLFGGGDLADTWEWNGGAWAQRDETGPEGRGDGAMAYDARRKRMVLFGGTRNGLVIADPMIWEWDGVAWSSQPGGAVIGMVTPRLAYDSKRGVMVMSAVGAGGTSAIWERTDAAWTKIADASTAIEALAYDPVREVMLAVDDQQDTFTWNGTMLKPLLVMRPPGGFGIRMATDPVHRTIIAMAVDSFGIGGGGLSEWDGTTWRDLTPDATAAPRPGGGAALTNDLQRRVALLHGGTDLNGETWTFDGLTWKRVALTGQQPGARVDHALAYRSADGESILYGGLTGTTLRADTWAWNGTTWRPLNVAGPTARRGVTMAYDVARDRIVLFGGSTDTDPRSTLPSPCNCTDTRTWEWDGVRWTGTAQPVSPAPRRDASMAYDPVRKVIVLFGGQREDIAFGNANDLWTYDGTWHEQHPLASPPGRFAASLVWDASRQRLVLFGGFQIHDSQGPLPELRVIAMEDSWEWDGARWRRLVTTTQPSRRGGHVGMTSPDGAGTVQVGGLAADFSGMGPLIENPHAIRWVAGVGEESCSTRVDADGDGLAGCADPDCWPWCSPRCPPATSCVAGAPRCGDGACDPLESKLICAADCGAPVTTCSDLVCDGGETCAADCP